MAPGAWWVSVGVRSPPGVAPGCVGALGICVPRSLKYGGTSEPRLWHLSREGSLALSPEPGRAHTAPGAAPVNLADVC